MKTVILCGGFGTRLRELTEVIPKPMVPIGGHPIVWHIMKHFARFGHTEFILCLGYKKESFIDYFVNYRARNSDLSVSLKDGTIAFCSNHHEDWCVTLADTGLSSNTGARIKNIEKYIEDDNFFLTYGDGLCDVDLDELLAFHRSQDGVLSVTAVHPSSRFGEIKVNQESRVLQFEEKPQTTSAYINGGFMVADRAIFAEYLNNDPDLDFESQVIRRVAEDGKMAAFRHEGFWQCMDTSREYQLLNRLWDQGRAPWKTW